MTDNNNQNFSNNVTDAVREALDAVLPKLHGGNVKFTDAYSPQEFTEEIKKASYDKLLILAEFFYKTSVGMKKDSIQGFDVFENATGIIYGTLQKMLQEAEFMYVIMEKSLKSDYPYIADGELLLFFDEKRAHSWCSVISNNTELKLFVAKVAKKDLPNIFVLSAIIGTENIRFHPEINNLRIRRTDIFKCDVKTVSNSLVRFNMLRFVQLQKTKREEQKKQAYAAMMGSISMDKFLIPGTEEGTEFRAITIADEEKTSWVPLFTDEMEIRHFVDVFPNLKEQFEKSVLKIISFVALKNMFEAPEMGGIVINPADVGLRIKRDTGKLMVENAEKIIAEQNKAKDEGNTNLN